MTKEFENLNLLLFYRWKRSYKFYGIVFALYLAFCLFALLMKGEQLGWVRYEVYFGSAMSASVSCCPQCGDCLSGGNTSLHAAALQCTASLSDTSPIPCAVYAVGAAYEYQCHRHTAVIAVCGVLYRIPVLYDACPLL